MVWSANGSSSAAAAGASFGASAGSQDVPMADSSSSPSTNSTISQVSQQTFREGARTESPPNMGHSGVDVQMDKASPPSGNSSLQAAAAAPNPLQNVNMERGKRVLAVMSNGKPYVLEGLFINQILFQGTVTNEPQNEGFFNGTVNGALGEGTWTSTDSRGVYNGFFLNKKIHGKGHYEYVDASGERTIYDGFFSNGGFTTGHVTNMKHGNGRYTGSMMNNVFWGEGTYREGNLLKTGVFENGRLIKGHVENLIVVESPQVKYSGPIENGREHGRGVSFSGGRKMEAVWEFGQFLDQVVTVSSEKWKMRYVIKNGKSDYSYIEVNFPDGSSYRGQGGEKGIFHGEGEVLTASGTKMKGNWVNGKKNGYFECINKAGFSYRQFWLDDVLQEDDWKDWKCFLA